MGNDESHCSVSLIMRDKVTRQCPQTTTFFKERGQPKRNLAEAVLLTSLMPYRWAKPAHWLIIMIILTQLFIQRNIFSGETILSACSHTHRHRHQHTQVYWRWHNLICSQYKQITNRDLRRGKTAARSWKRGRSVVLEKKKYPKSKRAQSKRWSFNVTVTGCNLGVTCFSVHGS